MKKIINNKMYNTETAEVIGASCIINGAAYSSDGYEWLTQQIESEGIPFYLESSVAETLYRKKNGELFLGREFSGDGCDENYERMLWVLENRIEPLSEKEARSWVEDRLDTDTYIELFGEPEE